MFSAHIWDEDFELERRHLLELGVRLEFWSDSVENLDFRFEIGVFA